MASVSGNNSANMLAGTSEADSINALDGNDTVRAGAGADTVFGGAGNDQLHGDNDSDRLFGGSGNDSLYGGSGDDTLAGEAGADLLNGGLGMDYADYSASDAGVTIVLDGGVAFGGHAAGDSLTGVDGIIGSNHADSLTGFDGQSTSGADIYTNVFFGGAGNDTLDGRGSNDQLYGGADNDSVIGGSGNDLVAGDDGNDTLFGGDGTDTLSGGAGADSLDGGAGNDMLDGGAGADRLRGTGADSLVGGADADVLAVDRSFSGSLDGSETGVDNDTLDLTGQGAFRVIRSALNGENGTVEFLNADGTVAGRFNFTNIENIVTSKDEVVEGSGGADVIDSAFAGDPEGDRVDALDNAEGSNADRIEAFGGNDTVRAGSGDDTVFGGDGADSIDGGDGSDILFGGSGSDQFLGGIGDHVDGGEDSDKSDTDVLDLSKFGFKGLQVDYDPTNPENGTVTFLDSFGQPTGRLSFTGIERVIRCFTPGTLIETERGLRPVETIRPGDRVKTRDHGLQPVREVLRRDLTRAELVLRPALRPVRIAAGALGRGLPQRDLTVSPQHRMLIEGSRAELLFGESEVLVPAVHMVGRPGIDRHPGLAGVTYIHLRFDGHEIVQAEGTWSESFQPGQAKAAEDAAVEAELLALFPGLRSRHAPVTAARMTLRSHETRVLMAA